MKKWMVAALAVLVLGYGDLLPFEHVDAGEMCLVETLLVEAKGQNTILYSIYGQGSGETPAEALADMERQIPGRLFLRQTRRVIFCGEAENQVSVLELPEEIPLGAVVYGSKENPVELLERMDSMERNLHAREQRGEDWPTLGWMKNEALRGEHHEDE